MNLTRREFVAGLTASCLLCGCAAEEKKPADPAKPSDPPPADLKPGELVDVPSAIRAPGDQAKVTLAAGTIVLLWKDEIGFHATAGRCTHRGSEIYYDPDRKDIACPEHKSRFYTDGSVEKGPAKVALETFTVTEEDGRLRIAPKG